MSKMNELKWIRVFTPDHIPKYLVEQINKRDYAIEDFYKYQNCICMKITDKGMQLNPFSHLYVLANEGNITKGFLWFTVEPLTKDIYIQIYSIDPEYWKSGGAVEHLCKFMKDYRRKGSLNKIYWITNHPKHSQKFGFKPSRSVLMEYKEEEDGKNVHRGDNTRGANPAPNTPTTTVSERDIGSGECSAASLSEISTAV